MDQGSFCFKTVVTFFECKAVITMSIHTENIHTNDCFPKPIVLNENLYKSITIICRKTSPIMKVYIMAYIHCVWLR